MQIVNIMKTVEEKAMASADEYKITGEQNRTMFSSGYLAGYNEAMRWRDPKEELPEFNKNDYPNGDYKRYLIKVVRGSISTRSYLAVGWLISANRWNVEMDWVNVIGWRPIE